MMCFLQRVLMGGGASAMPVTTALPKIPSQRCPLSARLVCAMCQAAAVLSHRVSAGRLDML